jgi:hypothetical protein
VAAKREFNLPDMIHPNARGYDIVVQNFYDFLVSQKLLV